MRALRVTFMLAGLLVLTRSMLVYYNSSEFSTFVRHEAKLPQSQEQLKRSLVEQARTYSFLVKESDISIDTSDAILRVAVDYTARMNFIVFAPELKFHVTGAGLLPAGR